MKTTQDKPVFKYTKVLAPALLVLLLPFLFSQCSPSVEEIKAENLPKLKAILAKHKPRIDDYKNKMLQLREILKGIDTPFVSPARLQPILRKGNTGAPQNLLIYSRQELDDPAMIAGFTSHYGMFCPESFKDAFYCYKESYLDNSFDDKPEYLEKLLEESSIDSFPYALIMEEASREKLVIDAKSFSGGTVQVKVYLVDMRNLAVLGYELITAEPPVIISARTHANEDPQSAMAAEAAGMTNLTIQEKVIAFLKKFHGFIYNYDVKQRG